VGEQQRARPMNRRQRPSGRQAGSQLGLAIIQDWRRWDGASARESAGVRIRSFAGELQGWGMSGEGQDRRAAARARFGLDLAIGWADVVDLPVEAAMGDAGCRCSACGRAGGEQLARLTAARLVGEKGDGMEVVPLSVCALSKFRSRGRK
jgi:hypothetical protein